jgi:hypothetical protein
MEHNNGVIYQLKVTLKGSKPAIWRRLQVQGNTDLHRLHEIIQNTMGWSNLHLYRFEIKGTKYGEISPEDDYWGLHFEDAQSTQLRRVIDGEKSKFNYEYDFGDNWEHEITVEKIIPAKAGVQYPVLLCTRQACPPEDCGGLRGYAELSETIRNPIEEEYARIMEECKIARIFK